MGMGSSGLSTDHRVRDYVVQEVQSNRSLSSLDDSRRISTRRRTIQMQELASDNEPYEESTDTLIYSDRRKKRMSPKKPWEPSSSAELTRTISQLAAANRQLAVAHNLALEHCRALLSAVPTPSPARRTLGVSTAKTRLSNKQSYGVRLAVKKKSRKRRKSSIFGSCDAEIPVLNIPMTIDDDNDRDNLREEIEQLRVSKSKSQKFIDELKHDLEQQRMLVERLTQDFEGSQRECEKKNASLESARADLKRSKLEEARLQAKLETFQCEKRQVQADEDETDAAVPMRSNDPSSANEEFRRELALKREARQRAIANISSEMDRLRSELETERLAHSETTRILEGLRLESSARDEKVERMQEEDEKQELERVEALRLLDLLKVSDELSLNLRLQLERTDDLRFQLESEPDEHRQRIGCLRRLAEEARESLRERRRQTASLKDRLAQILARLAEASRLRLLAGSDEIRLEAERQLGDVARARQLCDERSRVLVELKEHSTRQLTELRVKNVSLGQDNQGLEEELRKTEEKVDTQDSEILNLESQLGLAKADCRDLQNQVSLINSLFTQMLLGASSSEMDLDRLTRLLQENHDLITGMAKEKGTEATALPKLLLDIVEQVDGRERETCDDERKGEDELQEKSIAHNLPKVWRILLELLSCQASSTPDAASLLSESSPDSCYKSVDTPTGPRLVISVSKTYIRLKELILEKKHLEKEMNRMKQLNSHLENKLSEQEQRLSTVSSELSKTWNVVGRMQAQHQQLHTHEKILRYELQQKRKILQELKQELEYCREKWESARQKNTNTEIEWKSLRREFAARKALVSHASVFSNSGESGFSDEREEESDEEDEREQANKRVRSRRRSKKDGVRVMSPDTESEQPTDTEFSESKVTSPSTTSGQQTPALEPVVESISQQKQLQQKSIEETSTATGASVVISTDDVEETTESRPQLDPLDKALAKVIENLLETDEVQDNPVTASCSDHCKPNISKDECTSSERICEEASTSAVFSIGPIPATELATASEGDSEDAPKFDPLARLPTEEEGITILDARAARLKSLEEQAEWLVKKVNDTNRRGSALSSRLEELHEAYGSIPAAPPMPDVLPSLRLRSELIDGANDNGNDDVLQKSSCSSQEK